MADNIDSISKVSKYCCRNQTYIPVSDKCNSHSYEPCSIIASSPSSNVRIETPNCLILSFFRDKLKGRGARSLKNSSRVTLVINGCFIRSLDAIATAASYGEIDELPTT